MNDEPDFRHLAKAIRGLSVAVWILCASVLALLAFSLSSLIYTRSFLRGAETPSRTRSGSSLGTSWGEKVRVTPFHELSMEERIKRSSVILLTEYRKKGDE